MIHASHPVPKDLAKEAFISKDQYDTLYQHSIQDPQNFWQEQAKHYLHWFKPWDTVLEGDFNSLNVQWFKGGKLNAAYNCLDRHLPARANQIALIWEGNDPTESKKITYSELHQLVCQLTNVLKEHGIKKGDRVCIYLPMIPEAIIAMLACARMGAIHSVVFGGFSAESLKNRILDAKCQLVITANEGLRGNKIIPLKQNVDAALKDCPDVKTVIIVQRTKNPTTLVEKRDVWYHEVMFNASTKAQAEEMDANDPLFILYTSGSTGKPKGILHSTAGYLLYSAITHQYVFDYHPEEIYWCTADVGWVTGHSYIVYGPLLNGATTLIFEGIPNHPTPARYWQVIDKYQVNIFYTAPTAIRALRQQGDQWLQDSKRHSLRILGTVGEAINPEVWEWYYHSVGGGRCPIVDTWWQTETGGIMISPLPGATTLKPGSATKPFFGVVAKIVDNQGKPVTNDQMGELIISQPWPGMMQTVYGDKQRFVDTYFKKYPGNYLTGDNACCDADGFFWIRGRSDDVIKVSGHRIGTQEVESALLEHSAVSEAAVVAIPHEIKGEGIYAFVTLKSNTNPSAELKEELIQTVRKNIGAIATPEFIQWAANLPKTRSGKIMRRLLKQIATDDTDELGDLSTLADTSVVQQLIDEKKNSEEK